MEISMKFVHKGPVNNIPSLVQIMAWRRAGVKLLSKLMSVRLPTHICVTRRQWVNTLRPEQDGRYSACYIFTCIFLSKNSLYFYWHLIEFVHKRPINIWAVLVLFRKWHSDEQATSHNLNQWRARSTTSFNSPIFLSFFNQVNSGRSARTNRSLHATADHL